MLKPQSWNTVVCDIGINLNRGHLKFWNIARNKQKGWTVSVFLCENSDWYGKPLWLALSGLSPSPVKYSVLGYHPSSPSGGGGNLWFLAQQTARRRVQICSRDGGWSIQCVNTGSYALSWVRWLVLWLETSVLITDSILRLGLTWEIASALIYDRSLSRDDQLWFTSHQGCQKN